MSDRPDSRLIHQEGHRIENIGQDNQRLDPHQDGNALFRQICQQPMKAEGLCHILVEVIDQHQVDQLAEHDEDEGQDLPLRHAHCVKKQNIEL